MSYILQPSVFSIAAFLAVKWAHPETSPRRFLVLEKPDHHYLHYGHQANAVGQFHGGSTEIHLVLKETRLRRRSKKGGGKGHPAGVGQGEEDGTTFKRCSNLVLVVFSLQNSSSCEGHITRDGPHFEVTIERCPPSQPSG